VGGTSLPRLNIGARPIVNKYCEGKMKSILKRELKVPETDRAEGNGESCLVRACVRGFDLVPRPVRVEGWGLAGQTCVGSLDLANLPVVPWSSMDLFIPLVLKHEPRSGRIC
jgi:hypothetical protein